MKYSVRRASGDWYYLTIPEDCRIAILPRPVNAGPGQGGSSYQIRVYRGPGTKKCLGQFFGTEIVATLVRVGRLPSRVTSLRTNVLP